ncbi:hypothetical protein KUV22_17080 [Microbulbifer agarilyticus]|uniref:STM3941 family protein n=1 Tax=Microbulbifer agarilyticus TaxID=260552 RepID=UPI001C97F7C6|nr:STM3941 family protein [Microbulbifer agarilyticus]MBY6192138.1 hypothetical protein [Microbulbifer agarilyticus]
MKELEDRVIKASQLKNALVVAGSIVFVCVGVWLLTLDISTIEDAKRFNNPTLVYALGIIVIFACGINAILITKKIFERKPALTLTADGIVDNSSPASVGKILWSEITGLREREAGGQKYIAILVKNPEKYCQSGNPIKRAINSYSLKTWGTPIYLTANSLKVDHQGLKTVVYDYYRAAKKRA